MRKAIKILLIIGYLWLVWDGLLGPLYAIFAERVGGDIFNVAGPYAVYAIVTGILHVVMGKLADKTRKAKKLMLAGYILACVATFGYLLVFNVATLYVLEFIFGLANAMTSSTWDGLYSKSIKDGNLVTMWSFVEAGYGIMYGLSAIAGGFIVTYFSFEILFIIQGIVMAIAVVLIIIFQEGERPAYG